MAISAKSKILASDINTALSKKQDALGYIPVKSVNGVTVDADKNVNIVGTLMPDYSACEEGTLPTLTSWKQVSRDSLVVIVCYDEYIEDYYVQVSPTADIYTSYIVGRREDDVNNNTQSITYTFFCPKSWYFTASAETQRYYYIYPIKGAI